MQGNRHMSKSEDVGRHFHLAVVDVRSVAVAHQAYLGRGSKAFTGPTHAPIHAPPSGEYVKGINMRSLWVAQRSRRHVRRTRGILSIAGQTVSRRTDPSAFIREAGCLNLHRAMQFWSPQRRARDAHDRTVNEQPECR